MQSNCAYWRTAVDCKPRRLTVDKRAHEQMILSRTDQRQRFKLRGLSRINDPWRSNQSDNKGDISEPNRQKLGHGGEVIGDHWCGCDNTALICQKTFVA